MKTKKIVVHGGTDNLFKISASKNVYTVLQIRVGLVLNTSKKIGTAKNFDDALSLIKSYSGYDIKEIQDW